MSLTPLTEPLGRKRAGHLLRRLCTSASISQIDAYALLTPAEAFAQLYTQDLPDPPLPLDPATGLDWVTTGRTDANSGNGILQNILDQWMMRQLLGADAEPANQLSHAFRERIVFFLHTLITTKKDVVLNSRAIYYQLALFRKYAFDRDDRTKLVEDPDTPEGEEPVLIEVIVPVNLKELTKKVSVDNAMLVFLDGRYNRRGRPNENYARELLELYSIGRGREGTLPESASEGDYFTFTETDVQQGARVFSGFEEDDTFTNIDEDTGLPRGILSGGRTIASQHDNGTKVFSERLDNTEIAPDPELTTLNGSATEESLLDEISQFVDMVYAKEETALHICRKLYRFFVYHEITDAIEEQIIQPMAQVFAANEFKLHSVLEALFTSQEFYGGGAGVEDDSFGGIIKSPLDLVLGFIHNFNIPIPTLAEEVANSYAFSRYLTGNINNQGLDFYAPFEVAGYHAYHQFPIYHRSWITTNYLLRRYSFIDSAFSEGGVFGDDTSVRPFIKVLLYTIDPYVFVRDNIDHAIARDAQALIITLAEYFLPATDSLSFADGSESHITQQRLNYFLSVFLGDLQEDPQAYWATQWDNPTEVNLDNMRGQLRALFNTLLQSPEYQLA